MKKNNSMRIAIVVIALTLITSCFVGSTFAKYTATVTANDTANVAKWDIKVNNGQIATDTPSFTFDLFSNPVKDTDGTSNETDVTNGLIAPGTSGSISLVIKNDSDVTANYAITLVEEIVNGGTAVTTSPIEYQVVAGTGAAAADGWGNAATKLNISSADLAVGAEAVTYTVYWRWAIGTDGTIDNAIGIAARETGEPLGIKVTATINVTQVD